jgi:hypothetical protein
MKKNQLQAFTQKHSNRIAPPAAGQRTRGRGANVAITVRLPKHEWIRLQTVAMSEGTSLQALALTGFNLALKAKGLPQLSV